MPTKPTNEDCIGSLWLISQMSQKRDCSAPGLLNKCLFEGDFNEMSLQSEENTF